MTPDDLSLDELEGTLSKINLDIKRLDGTRAVVPLREVRDNLTGMLVAARELDKLDQLHRRGDIVTDIYLSQRKKLTTDYYEQRNRMFEASLPALIESAPTTDKSKLRTMGQAIKESKEFLIPLMNLVSAVISLFGK